MIHMISSTIPECWDFVIWWRIMTEPTATLGSQGQRQRHRRLEMFERGRDDGRCTMNFGSALGVMKQENINLGIMIFLGMLSLWSGYVGLCCNDEFKVYYVYSIFRLFLASIASCRSTQPEVAAWPSAWPWEKVGVGKGVAWAVDTFQDNSWCGCNYTPPLHILLLLTNCPIYM